MVETRRAFDTGTWKRSRGRRDRESGRRVEVTPLTRRCRASAGRTNGPARRRRKSLNTQSRGRHLEKPRRGNCGLSDVNDLAHQQRIHVFLHSVLEFIRPGRTRLFTQFALRSCGICHRIWQRGRGRCARVLARRVGVTPLTRRLGARAGARMARRDGECFAR
jgi:hypothetical protein